MASCDSTTGSRSSGEKDVPSFEQEKKAKDGELLILREDPSQTTNLYSTDELYVFRRNWRWTSLEEYLFYQNAIFGTERIPISRFYCTVRYNGGLKHLGRRPGWFSKCAFSYSFVSALYTRTKLPFALRSPTVFN